MAQRRNSHEYPNEVVRNVFERLDKRSLARCMQAGRLFADISRPILWSNVDSSKQLQALLNRLSTWEGIHFSSDVAVPSAVNWPQFLDYTRMVKSLVIFAEGRVEPKLRFISMARPVLDIMPNLQRLTYHLTNETDTLALSSLFTHSGLQALSFEKMRHLTRTTATSFRATSLVSLDLEFSFQNPHETAADFISSLPPLPHLKSITLPSWKANAATLAALGGKFPCLEEISTGEHVRSGLLGRNHYRFLCIGHSSPDLFSRGGLRSLKKMTISASYDIANSAIEDPNFPITINCLRLEIYHSDMVSDSGYDRLLRLLGERLSLTSITLLDDRPGEESPIHAMIENGLLPSLTSLELNLNNRFNLDDELVHSLATSLPLLEKFILTQYPRGKSTTNLPDWTIVPIFARHCPLLKEFGSVFDPTTPNDMESTPLVQFRSLRRFYIGECALPRKCISNMTVLFTLVFPPDCSIHCDEGPRAEYRGWSSVVENYKTMQQVRRLQERMNT